VLVKGDRTVGQGYHQRFGGPHAEVNALRAAGRRAKGATAYVTLEPCCHHGKTPPCTDALIAAGIRRILVAMRDPFSQVRGRGIRQLRSAGIDVITGLCEADARQFNAPYLKRQQTHRPWVILKWAQSLDGKIATRTGDSRWISSEPSRRWAHRLRGRVDAVVVGVGTVLADDPELTCRHVRPKRIATRIVLDPHLRTPKRARLVQTASEVPTLIVTDRRSAVGRRADSLRRAGVELLGLRQTRTGLDLGTLLDELGARGMTNVLIEGGGQTLGTFFDADLADEAVVFVSHRLIGGRDAPSALQGQGPRTMRDVPWAAHAKRTRRGHDDVYQLALNTNYLGKCTPS
ncbi:MAG: bifunctional diaminohydroxyphosphoribosylaminopyrimidine deaminase/5-amino-6-(5-phosphoribosylamino)uracil reductase RibD, partial [Sedimentisphaerales bacterium]|nr:bifunctional diaminohydroxyphosphoribosylaminopyrimidine deaminase/5-amino-6-(5-phosphoribosylamino)uracil reductase RibD [Sedimentisphaerales bacterium]